MRSVGPTTRYHQATAATTARVQSGSGRSCGQRAERTVGWTARRGKALPKGQGEASWPWSSQQVMETCEPATDEDRACAQDAGITHRHLGWAILLLLPPPCHHSLARWWPTSRPSRTTSCTVAALRAPPLHTACTTAMCVAVRPKKSVPGAARCCVPTLPLPVVPNKTAAAGRLPVERGCHTEAILSWPCCSRPLGCPRLR